VQARAKPSFQAWNFLITISVLLVLVLAVFLCLNLITSRQRYEDLATTVARSVFKQLVAVREWSTQHGGVYVQVNENLRFDPDLEDPSGHATTSDGRPLRRIHPEYVIRLVSDILVRESGIRIGVTSLKLTSEENAPDAWERGALEALGRGSSEQFAIVGHGQAATFRYMAPLKTEESCLGCHVKQGYKLGDMRGGLSVSFSYVPFQEAVSKNNAHIWFAHAVFLLSGLIIIWLLGRHLIAGITELQEKSAHIKRLEGLLPICTSCKKIRAEGADPKEQESWIPIEIFIGDKTDAEFTHGLCPECVKKLYGREYGQ
jgi:Protein of unknown function (DUF3365)